MGRWRTVKFFCLHYTVERIWPRMPSVLFWILFFYIYKACKLMLGISLCGLTWPQLGFYCKPSQSKYLQSFIEKCLPTKLRDLQSTKWRIVNRTATYLTTFNIFKYFAIYRYRIKISFQLTMVKQMYLRDKQMPRKLTFSTYLHSWDVKGCADDKVVRVSWSK